MKKAKKRISSGTKILKALTKKDKMKSVELRQIAFDNKTGKSAYKDTSHPYYKSGVKKVPQGWWCVGIKDLRNGGMMEQDDNGLYSITELGKLNIDKPFTKNPIMTQKMYTEEIDKWRSKYVDASNTRRRFLWKLEEEQESNGELLKKNAELISENETLKSQINEYQKTEEIQFLYRMVSNLVDTPEELDSYSEDVINRIIGRLKK